MTKPGIGSSSKLRLPWKWIAGAGVVGAGLLALSQCDGNDGQQSTAEITPVDKDTPYYQIIKDTRMRANPDSGYIRNLWIKQGSCVQGIVEDGKQKEGGGKYLIRAESNDGTVKEGYISAGNIGMQNLDPSKEGFTCKAQFAEKSNVNSPVLVAAPTYVAGETVNLRDGGSMEAPIWGTLAKGSCVTDAGSHAADDLMMVGIATANSAPNPVNYLWVKKNQMQTSTIPAERCVATVTAGTQAGITPRP